MTIRPESHAIVVRAPAKVNLTLEVVGRRPDGFHALRSIFAAIALHDQIEAWAAPDLSVSCDVPELATPANLAWRAADALRRDVGIRGGAHLHLQKGIPLEAGMGGGSADAAAALVALDALWGLGLPRARLRDIGATIGSDVPFFLGESPVALVSGRGEVLAPLEVPPILRDARCVLVRPHVGIGAGAVYRAYPPERWAGDNDRTAAWVAAAAAADSIDRLPAPLNDLEPIALQVEPAAAAARDALIGAGAPHAVMSGSGSTFFACVGSAAAQQIVGRLAETALRPGWFVGHAPLGALPLRVQASDGR